MKEADLIVLYHMNRGYGYKVFRSGQEFRSLYPFNEIPGEYLRILKMVKKDCTAEIGIEPKIETLIPKDSQNNTSARILNESEMIEVLQALAVK